MQSALDQLVERIASFCMSKRIGTRLVSSLSDDRVLEHVLAKTSYGTASIDPVSDVNH